MVDIGIACRESFAAVTLPWGHCQYCRRCFEVAQVQDNGAEYCAMCRRPVVYVTDSRNVQLGPVTLANSLTNYDVLRKDYPFGALLFGNEPIIATQDVCQIVREAMAAVEASKLQLNDLKRALRQRLTLEQYDIVFVELIKNEDLHGILKQLDKRKFEKRCVTTKIQQMVLRLVESPDESAVISRAIATKVACLGIDLISTGASGFATAGSVSNLVVFLGFTALEIYRWAKGSAVGSSGKALAKNIGEHAVGALGGAVGSYYGCVTGAAIGTTELPVIGSIIGGMMGSIIGGLVVDGAGRLLYRKVFPGKETEVHGFDETEAIDLNPRELVEKSAARLAINIDLDSFEEAQGRFRRQLLANHPDKHPGVSEEERMRLNSETADILACWAIVREFYKDRGDVANNDCDEGFIRAFFLKVLDKASQQWRIVRMFFDDVISYLDVDPSQERLEQVMIYL